MDTVSLISTFVLIFTLIIMIIQTALLRKQIREDHEWKRREKSLLYSQYYNETLRKTKDSINNAFGYIQSRENPLTTDELNRSFDENPSLRNEINFLLAYLENIGLAVRHNIASFDVIYDLMANTYLKYFFLFRPYINKAREHNPRLWENFEFLAHEIENERRNRNETPVRLPRLG